MTQNQIAYSKFKEEGRHNLETESQGREAVKAQQLSASANWWQAETAAERAKEDARANRMKETISWFQSQETARSNMAQESLAQYKTDLEMAERRYATDIDKQLREAETAVKREQLDINRHQAESSRISALASNIAANAKMLNARVSERAQLETARHNLAAETQARINQYEVERNNRATLQEKADQRDTSERLKLQELQQNLDLRNRELDIAAQNAGSSRISALANQYNAETNRGAAYAEGFKDVTMGLNQASDMASNIYNIAKGVTQDAQQRKTWVLWED